MCSKKLEEIAPILLDHCQAYLSAEVLKSKEGKVRTVFLQRNRTALIQPMNQGIAQAYNAHYPRQLLPGFVSSELQVTKYRNTLLLKDTANNAGYAWEKD